jgi:hypothetical protein
LFLTTIRRPLSPIHRAPAKSEQLEKKTHMSRYKSDDGTFWMGLGAAGLAIIAFCAGYTVRDSGYVLNATKTPALKELQTK